MKQCIDVNCWYHKDYGQNKICPITKEVHDIGKKQIKKQESERVKNCFRIIRHELLKKTDDKIYHNLSMLKQIREYMI